MRSIEQALREDRDWIYRNDDPQRDEEPVRDDGGEADDWYDEQAMVAEEQQESILRLGNAAATVAREV